MFNEIGEFDKARKFMRIKSVMVKKVMDVKGIIPTFVFMEYF